MKILKTIVPSTDSWGQGFHSVRGVMESQGICQRIRENQGNQRFFGKSQGKVRGENVYPWYFLTSVKESFTRRNVCS